MIDFAEEGGEGRRGPSLSPSKIKTMLSCGALFRFRYVEKRPQPPKATLAIGTWMDGLMNAYWTFAKAHGILMPTADLILSAEATFRQVEDTVPNFEEEGKPEKVLAGCKKALEQYAEEFAPRMRPLEVQPWIEIADGTIGTLRARGRADLFTVDGEIVDHKCGKAGLYGKKYDETPARVLEALRRDIQLGLYAVGYHQMYGKPPSAIRIIRFAWGSGKVQEARVVPDAQMVAWVMLASKSAAARIEAKDYAPNPEFRYCSTCEYATACMPAYGGGATGPTKSEV